MKDHLDNLQAQSFGKTQAGSLGTGAVIGHSSIQEAIDQQMANQCGRQSLRESIVSRLMHARQESSRAVRLQRFADLADRNPEVLEMLELVRDLNLM